MIHVCTQHPWRGHSRAWLYGKGPSYRPCDKPGIHIGINEAAFPGSWMIARDWTVVAGGPCSGPLMTTQRIWSRRGDCEWVHDHYCSYYFDEGRLIAPVGTASAALQLIGEAGIRNVTMIGMDSFFGGSSAYHDTFTAMGLDPEDYDRRFNIGETRDQTNDRIRTAMQTVIDGFGLSIDPA